MYKQAYETCIPGLAPKRKSFCCPGHLSQPDAAVSALGWFLGAGYVPKEAMSMLSSQPSMFTGVCGPLRLLIFSGTSAGATYLTSARNKTYWEGFVLDMLVV